MRRKRRAHEPNCGRSRAPARLAAFAQGLADLGWTIGRNLRIDYRWAGGDPERIRKDAEELVALTPDLILSSGTPTVAALQKATRSVPIVFVQVVDPVGSGVRRDLGATGNACAIRHKLAGLRGLISTSLKADNHASKLDARGIPSRQTSRTG
jgi:hypothetical protein